MPEGWRVLITARSFAEGSLEPLERLRRAGVDVLQPRIEEPLGENELAAMLGEVDGLIAGLDRVGPRPLTRGHPRLKVIARNGVGVDTIDILTATRLGIIVTNAPGVNTDAVADLVFGLMVALARDLMQGDRTIREGRWSRGLGREVCHKTLGLIGLGQIGRAVARRAAGFQMRSWP